PCSLISFFILQTPSSATYTLSLHDALPISAGLSTCTLPAGCTRPSRAPGTGIRMGTTTSRCACCSRRTSRTCGWPAGTSAPATRSEEHTSELQSRFDLVCRLLLEKKKQLSY